MQTSISIKYPQGVDISEMEKYEKVANTIDLYQARKESLIQVLHVAQQVFGCLSPEVQVFIAENMDIPLAKVTGVVSFYSFFSTQPRGRHTIRICLGTACYVRGGKKLIQALEDKLGIKLGNTTEDGMFTLEVARCIGSCGLAPAIMIDDQVYKQVSINKVGSILDAYYQQEVNA